MQVWKVMYWGIYISQSNWPEAYGYVPGVNWTQAVENARYMWQIDFRYVVSAEEI